jgi:hypothetical protein
MKKIGDIDVDVKSHMDRTPYGTRAIQYLDKEQRLKPHPSGWYIDDVPVDPETGMSTLHYKDMEEAGFIKVDLISNTAYDQFKSKKEVLENLNKEPDWDLLLDKGFIEKLPHLPGHIDILRDIRPRSIMELADTLALIRPGKIHLIEDYLEDREKVRKRLYARPRKGYYIKKSHAVAYAHMIVCVMNRKDSKRLLNWKNSKRK